MTGWFWLRRTQNWDWTIYLRALGLGITIFILTPTMIWFAWPVSAQTPPAGVSGNCNNFGNNNFNCNTLNVEPNRLKSQKNYKLNYLQEFQRTNLDTLR